MSPDKLHHVSLRAAIAGALVPLKGRDSPTPHAMARQVWAWADASLSLDPQYKLPDGLCVGASLLRDPSVPFCAGFFQDWKDRYGTESLFPDGEKALPEFWAQRLTEAIKKDLSHRAKDAARVLAWVLENAPEGQLDPDVAREAFEMIEANRRGGSPLPEKTAATLSAQLEKILGERLDPLRPPLRWSAKNEDLEAGVDLSALVRLPSGRVRPLEDWVRLRSGGYNSHPAPGSPRSTLPTPPHGKRLELARDWVLDPEASLDQARSRLWAVTRSKPSSVATLLEWLDNPPKNLPDCPERIASILKARDPLGRSYLAFLSTPRAGEYRQRESFSRHLLHKGLVPSTHIHGEQGQGLVEQVFDAQRLGHADPEDALGGGVPSPEAWVIELYGQDIYQGPADRRQELEDDIADSLLPGLGYHRVCSEALEQAFPSEKVRQAALWATLNQVLAKKFETHNLPRTRAAEATSRTVSLLRETFESLSNSINDNPGLLWIGETEFAQFKSMIYPPALEYDSLVPQEFRSVVYKGMEVLERAVLTNSMHLEFDEPSSQPSRRFRL